MIALIPPVDSSLAFLRPEARPSPEESFAEVLKSAATQESQPQSATTSTYQVQRGDSLREIAKKLGISNYMEIARANGIKNPDLIQPGQILQLPGAGSEKKGSSTETMLAKASQTKRDPAVYAQKVAASSSKGTSKGTLVTTSWYGAEYHGKTMSNGQRFDMYKDTAAHRTLPMGAELNLTNPANGNSVEVKITDRGPFIAGRNLDVSYNAARKLGIVEAGVAKVLMNKL